MTKSCGSGTGAVRQTTEAVLFFSKESTVRRLCSLSFLAVALSLSGAPASASGRDGPDDSPVGLCLAAFQRAFNVPASKISGLAQSGLPIDEMPVLFFAANRLEVDPGQILQRRLRGRRWQAVLDSFGTGPSIFYAPIDPADTTREPFKRLRGLKSEEWDRAFLSDREVVDLATMRFAADAYGALPSTFIEMRSAGMSPVEVVAWFEVERAEFLDWRERQDRWEDEQRDQRRDDDDYNDRQRELKRLDQEYYDNRLEQQRLDQEYYEKRLEQQRLDEEYRKRQEEQKRRDEEYRKSRPA